MSVPMDISIGQKPTAMSRKRAMSRKMSRSFSKRLKKPALLRSPDLEVNFVDLPTTVVNITAGANNPSLLNGLVPGTGNNQRSGRKITMKSVQIHGEIEFSQFGTAPIDDNIRVILVYDRQTNAALPAWSDIIQSITVASATSSSSYDFPNKSNYDRFKIIRDFKLKMPAAITPVTTAARQLEQLTYPETRKGFDWYVKLKGLETHYNTGTAGTVADITTGSLLLFAQGLSNINNFQWDLSFNSRVSFVA